MEQEHYANLLSAIFSVYEKVEASQSTWGWIGDFRNVFKFHAYSVLTKGCSWRQQSLSELARPSNNWCMQGHQGGYQQ